MLIIITIIIIKQQQPTTDTAHHYLSKRNSVKRSNHMGPLYVHEVSSGSTLKKKYNNLSYVSTIIYHCETSFQYKIKIF